MTVTLILTFLAVFSTGACLLATINLIVPLVTVLKSRNPKAELAKINPIYFTLWGFMLLLFLSVSITSITGLLM